MLRISFSLLILVLIANSALSHLTDRVTLSNLRLTPIGSSKYDLKIFQTDGNILELFMEKSASGQYALKARVFPIPPYRKFFDPRSDLLGPQDPSIMSDNPSDNDPKNEASEDKN